ncbi:hypothetical protein Tsp_02766 [Trichinella spiralis]|uniref:hypothetical protein n=1 Tax=Trichinella spiralis TaxID=6334 RepID=UPI0001EFC386|nr:hypothetical protein Tsp_02766 [Trichinella spiralis]
MILKYDPFKQLSCAQTSKQRYSRIARFSTFDPSKLIDYELENCKLIQPTDQQPTTKESKQSTTYSLVSCALLHDGEQTTFIYNKRFPYSNHFASYHQIKSQREY